MLSVPTERMYHGWHQSREVEWERDPCASLPSNESAAPEHSRCLRRVTFLGGQSNTARAPDLDAGASARGALPDLRVLRRGNLTLVHWRRAERTFHLCVGHLGCSIRHRSSAKTALDRHGFQLLYTEGLRNDSFPPKVGR